MFNGLNITDIAAVEFISFAFACILMVLVAALIATRHLKELKAMKKQHRVVLREKTASETRLAKMAEYMVPFMDCWPYDPDKFRFIGHPCDGIQFTDDSIIFVEIKTGKNRLSKSQNHLRYLVNKGNIRFATFRLDGDGWNLKFEDEEE